MAKMIELSEAAREAKREYYRQWRKRNPDRKRESDRRYWEKKAHEATRRGAESNPI